MDTTLADYKDGGSFNYLGLDIGKHYIDHCNNLFEAHSAFIIAIRQTEKKWTAFQTERSENKISGSASLTILGYILSGEDFYKLPYNVLSVSEKKRSFAEKLIHRLFRKYYSLAQRKTVPFQVDTVNRIASACQLSERYDTQEFIRSLLFVDVFGEWGKSKDEIYEEYRACAEKGHEPLIPSLIDIKRCIKEELSRLYIKLPNHVEGMRTFFKKYVAGLPTALIDHQSNGLAYFHTMSTMIEDAGVTCLLGLTGWRASEYGFPLSSIQISLNHDSLDNQYTPWRFHVHWKVPKTSGSTPLFREITLGSYILIAQLAALNGADYQKPALYKVSTEGQMNHSENTIKKAVNTCWADFIKNYVIFSDIDRYHKLTENLDVLDETEIKELNHLKSQYQFESSTLIEISRIKDQLNNDFPRVELCEKQGRGLTFGDNLRRFAEGIASLEITQLLDKFLSEETIAKLKSGDFALDKAGVRFVRSEFLDGTPHPTSHAFRHIWAEAVLRRYRGDIGKFIRANFKHIDERFFMAYLRGKEMKIIHQVASRDVINSVVRQQLNSLNDKYREYAGGFDRFLSKAVNITKIYSHEDLTELADKISNERVLSIKPNPWTDCLLKAGTNNLAKCSVDGVPNRQNASPRLCLGCINGNIAEGNFNGIVVYLQQDVAACRNNQLPWFIKQQHVQVVIIALKRVKELSRNSTNEKHYKFIRHLEESLRLALDNMGDEL